MSVFRCDIARLSQAKATPQGGLEIPGALTRTGVFTYHNADGSIRRELRLPDEVFQAEHVDTIRGAPVTIGHPGEVNASNWKQLAVGHVRDAVDHAGEGHVGARLVIQDASAVDQIKRGDLKEISLGYTVDLEEKPGEWNGQKYDAIQHNMRVNHVALGPEGWGRAGKTVALRTDGAYSFEESKTHEDMSEALQKSLDAAQGEITALKLRLDAAEKAAVKPEDLDTMVTARVALIESARKVAPELKHDGKSDAEIVRETVKVAFPDLKLDGKSDDFCRGVFETACTAASQAKVAVGNLGGRADADSVQDKIAAARKQNEEASKNAWKKGR